MQNLKNLSILQQKQEIIVRRLVELNKVKPEEFDDDTA